MRTHVTAVVAGALLCGCAGATAAPQPIPGGSAASPSPTHTAFAGELGPTATPVYVHWDMARPVHMRVVCDDVDGPPMTLHDALVRERQSESFTHGDLSVALVRSTGAGPAQWNTADAERPSQAYVDSLRHPTPAPDGSWPIQPSIVTPYAFQVLRSVEGPQLAPRATGWLDGGQVAQDQVIGCRTPPETGQSYLGFFRTDLIAEGPANQPVIEQMYPYDPSTDMVQWKYGPTKLADALAGLPQPA